MRSRRLVVSSAALVAAVIGFLPGTAQAADPSAPGAQRVTKPADPKKIGASNFRTFTSGADKSVRKGPSGVARAAGAAATGNPDLNVALSATNTGAHSLQLWAEVTSADAALEVTVSWGDGKVEKLAASGSAQLLPLHTYAEVGEYKITVAVNDAANKVSVENELEVVTSGSEFTPYEPTRLLDTREGFGAPKAKVAPYSSARVKVGGYGTIPAGVRAVVLNVTVTNTTSGGHITAFDAGNERPNASNINFEPGQTVPNLVVVPVGNDGSVDLYNGGWESVDLIADITGYFMPKAANGYTPMDPTRFVDTREGLGTSKGQVPGRTSFGTQIAGLRGVPQGVKAVALNVTVTGPKEAGHLIAYPGGGKIPLASNVNFTAGQTVANSVIVPVGADGSINIRNNAWAGADVIVDVLGYYSPAGQGAFMPLSPMRFVDTRNPDDAIIPLRGPIAGRGYAAVPFFTEENADFAAYVLNTTVTNTAGGGFLSVAPDPNSAEHYESGTAVTPARPGASTLNWTKGKTVPNLVQASGGKYGIVDFWNQGWEKADLVVDISGYYENPVINP
ncbi:PKD domain-containing protein [Streptomyces erythrochromogenes]|uniref:PKD domain-containing protein n=1 Tax=Streptomyces erythrochromogenes TaxID=285574 RepID=UPI00386402C6|nr:PKD domain-containing protein [Streptomyces erythrochromogenes]